MPPETPIIPSPLYCFGEQLPHETVPLNLSELYTSEAAACEAAETTAEEDGGTYVVFVATPVARVTTRSVVEVL